MSGSTSLPLIMSAAGPQPTPPATLQATLIANVAATNPGYTANLPGSLIEDISSTDVGALTIIDQARVDAVNSVTPYGANAYILNQLGYQFGLPQGQPTNASVYLVFSGPAGYAIPAGFTVSDGTYQYAVQDGGVIGSSGATGQLYAVATQAGTWAIPANTVTQIITSVPSIYSVNVTNPNAGTPGTIAGETVDSYRSRVLLAGQVTSTGTAAYLKTLLYAISGVQQQLVSVRQVGSSYQIICGGGDAYAAANAILTAIPNISLLQGSALTISSISVATNAVVGFSLNHNLSVGGAFTITGATPSAYNATYTVTAVNSPTSVTTNVNSSAFGAYSSGATLTPNPRNVSATIFQEPDSYTIAFVNPPQQTVVVTATWNTTLSNFTAANAVAQLAAPAIQNYINGIYVGQPINLLEMTADFQAAVASVLPAVNLTTLQFAVTINGVTVSPSAGTSIITGDPESYFYCTATGVTVTQG